MTARLCRRCGKTNCVFSAKIKVFRDERRTGNEKRAMLQDRYCVMFFYTFLYISEQPQSQISWCSELIGFNIIFSVSFSS